MEAIRPDGSPGGALVPPLTPGKRPQDRLFQTAGEPWAEGRHKRPFTAAERAGPDPGVTFHSLRHASITRMLRAGVPTQAVAEHHGTSARMVEANYARFVPADRARYAALSALSVDVVLPRADVGHLRRTTP